MEYTSEQEQVEALKKWLKQNGLPIAVGLVLGLGSLFGWRAWQSHGAAKSEVASAGFQRVMAEVTQQKSAEARETAKQVLGDFSDTAYAAMASLMLARLAVEEGDIPKAKEHLQWVIDQRKQPALADVARLRLARLHLAEGDAAGAATLLDRAPALPQSAELSELRGDILVAEGKRDEARAHYAEALALAPPDPNAGITPLELKLEDLGTASAPAAVTAMGGRAPDAAAGAAAVEQALEADTGGGDASP